MVPLDGATSLPHLWLLVYSLVPMLFLTISSAAISDERKPDTLFANWTELAGRNVTCDNWKHPPVKFPSDTWSCYNIRVDGRRLRYWYIPGFGAETHCSDGKKKNDGLNDVAALCRAMLKAHGISRELWTAYVNDASCRRSNKERFVFRQVNGKYKFDTFPSGHGYIILLRCMTAA